MAKEFLLSAATISLDTGSGYEELSETSGGATVDPSEEYARIKGDVSGILDRKGSGKGWTIKFNLVHYLAKNLALAANLPESNISGDEQNGYTLDLDNAEMDSLKILLAGVLRNGKTFAAEFTNALPIVMGAPFIEFNPKKDGGSLIGVQLEGCWDESTSKYGTIQIGVSS